VHQQVIFSYEVLLYTKEEEKEGLKRPAISRETELPLISRETGLPLISRETGHPLISRETGHPLPTIYGGLKQRGTVIKRRRDRVSHLC
jgi:hypothetical protein